MYIDKKTRFMLLGILCIVVYLLGLPIAYCQSSYSATPTPTADPVFATVCCGIFVVPIAVILYLWYRKANVEDKRVKASKENHDVEGLVKGLTYSKSVVRNEAAKALGELKDPAAIDALVRALNDPDRDVRNSAAYSLQEYGVENLGALITGIAKSPGSTIRANKTPVRPIDINVQPDSDNVQSRIVTCDLGPETIGTLIAAMGGSDPLFREKSIEVIELFGPFAVDPLIQALGGSDKDHKLAIITVLGDIGDVRALEPVKQAQADSDPAVRDVATIAYKKLSFTDTAANIPDTQVDLSNVDIDPSVADYSQFTGDGSNTDQSYLQELEKLGELRSKGILSDEEFQREKKEILFKANKVEMIKCQYCGSSIEAFNEKCPVCGAPVKETGTSPETSES